MDISGGMPAVIIKMLVASDPDRIQLLPALPAAWPKGALEGALCRGAIEVKNLQWDGKNVQATLVSVRARTVTIELPTEIAKLTISGRNAKSAKADTPAQRQLTLPAGEAVSIEIQLK